MALGDVLRYASPLTRLRPLTPAWYAAPPRQPKHARAATKALELRARILDALASETTSVGDLAAKLEADAETCLLLLEHLAANTKRTGVVADGGGYRRK